MIHNFFHTFIQWLIGAGLYWLVSGIIGAVLLVLSFVSYWWHMELRYKYRWSDPRCRKPDKQHFQKLF